MLSQASCISDFETLSVLCVLRPVGQNLFRTSNSIGSCWPEALLFQSWGPLLVLFGLGLSIVF